MKISIVGVTSNEEAGAFAMMLPTEFYKAPKKGRFLLGAMDEDQNPVGVCWYRFTGNEYEIVFLGVHPLYRRMGIGTVLLKELLRSFYSMNMVYPVSVIFEQGEETRGFKEFLLSMGNFFFEEPDHAFRLTREDREQSKMYQRMKNRESNAVNFFDQPQHVRQSFLSDQKKKDLHFLEDVDADGIAYDKSLCFCLLTDGRIMAALFTKKLSDKEREISYLYADEHHSELLPDVFAKTVQAIEEQCPDAVFYMQTVNERALKLLLGFFKESNPVSHDIEYAFWDYTLL